MHRVAEKPREELKEADDESIPALSDPVPDSWEHLDD